ncbi:MAG: hypothetical protein DELT_03116 [Desulfovibrio sp.]
MVLSIERAAKRIFRRADGRKIPILRNNIR